MITQYTITLTTQNDAGDLYDVYYTIDGVNYFLSASDIYLPQGGSAVVNVDSMTCKIKLLPASGPCVGFSEYIIDVGTCVTTTTTACPTFKSFDIVSASYSNINDLGAQWVNWNTINGGFGGDEVSAGEGISAVALKAPNDTGYTVNYPMFGSAGNNPSTSTGASMNYCVANPLVWTFQGLAGVPINQGGYGTLATPLDIIYMDSPTTWNTTTLNFAFPFTQQIVSYGPVFMREGGGNSTQYKVVSIGPYDPTTTTTTTASGPSNIGYFGISSTDDSAACSACGNGGFPLYWTGSFSAVGTELFTDYNRTQWLLNANYVVNCNFSAPPFFGEVISVNSVGITNGGTGLDCG